ncbi:MarR family transcriptional regulator [Helicobacter didelphidarum]|uniref:MarR family transcriptional regulator n=1 Tax=Helicobacter didelphidarum TaxID=2040648 RepID=A0A3D8IKQ2_9HELI|nr:MarR family transcriptional regulator [Helicobacter didelphidarum]RDU65789.1 MarR family transcriptional regulator [Helicobacter didelphidarum]
MKTHQNDEIPNEILRFLENQSKEHIGPHLFLATRKMKKFIINHLRKFDIGFEQVGVMHTLHVAHLNINQLAKVMYKDRGTISRCVESLCAKGYVVKIKSTKDQRIHTAKLTPAGEQFLESLEHLFTNTIGCIENLFTPEENTQFHHLLDKLVDSISKNETMK